MYGQSIPLSLFQISCQDLEPKYHAIPLSLIRVSCVDPDTLLRNIINMRHNIIPRLLRHLVHIVASYLYLCIFSQIHTFTPTSCPSFTIPIDVLVVFREKY